MNTDDILLSATDTTLPFPVFSEKELPVLPQGVFGQTEAQLWRDYAHERGAILVIDKPLTWTSFDIVAKMRGTIKMKKIGHAGTLDPLATGVLVLCIGRATKQVESIQQFYKIYDVTIKLGATTRSDDGETPEENHVSAEHITVNDIHDSLLPYIGTIHQIPPIYSAVWINGQRAYQQARKGKDIEIEPRPVRIDSIEILAWDNPFLTLRIQCGKGTYIRSLARDIGADLGVGGYVQTLRRNAVGQFTEDQSWTVQQIADLFSYLKNNTKYENI